jgi:hypothetical protein
LITSDLLEAHLACRTKCYLRSIGEVGSGNTYAAWNQTRNESYRREGAGIHTLDSAHDKAYTSVSFKNDTLALAERAKGEDSSP